MESNQPTNLPNDRFSPVVVVPTFNNAGTLLSVLEGVEAQGLSVIVVDDGSTDDTATLLDAWRTGWVDNRHLVVVHTENRGKAAALRTGFDTALAANHTHALTIDSDGQLNPDEIPLLLDAARENPASLIVGVRDIYAADYPRKSRMGRIFSNAAVKLECGQRVRDSQCGFRVYPLALLKYVRCATGRYAFETEVLTRSVWAGAGIVERPVTCLYTMEGGRVSHFRPGMDTLHGLLLHARLLAWTILPVAHAHPWHDPNGRDRKERDPRPWWRRMLHWVNPFAAWREIRAGELRRDELAASVAVGVFIGNLPLYGLHTVLCVYSAARLHLNPHLVILGSTVATPPIGIGLIVAAVVVGHLILHGSMFSFAEFESATTNLPALAGQFMLEWVVGSLVVGFAISALSLVLSYGLFGWIQRRTKKTDFID